MFYFIVTIFVERVTSQLQVNETTIVVKTLQVLEVCRKKFFT